MYDVFVSVFGVIVIGMELRFGWRLADALLQLLAEGLSDWSRLFTHFCARLKAKRKG